MTRTTSTFSTLFLLLATASIGCATASGGGHRDVHASATLTGDGPRMLVEGPALLMHVDVEGRGDLALYTVSRNQGGDVDCASAPAGERVPLRAGGSTRVNLTVAGSHAVCVTPAAGRASILWHAAKLDGGGAGAESMLAMRAGVR